MIIIIRNFLELLPLLIVGWTVIVVMLSISWRRDHFTNATLTVIGLNLALLSLYFMSTVGEINATSLVRMDGYTFLYTIFVIFSSQSTCTFAYYWLVRSQEKYEEFYILILIATMGCMLLTMTNHLFSLFLGIELISLPLFGLIGYTSFKNKISLEASIKYMILSSSASSFLLFGMALLYAESGHMSLYVIGNHIKNHIMHKKIIINGIFFLLVGLLFKISVVPFQLWTPDVYQGAPAAVTTFLSTASKISTFSVLVRFLLYAPAKNHEAVYIVLSIISICSIFFGNIMAISQKNIKRLLGYSSIAHLGYLLVTIISVPTCPFSMETIGMYLLSYLLSNLGVFGVVNFISSTYRYLDADSLFSYRGLFWHKPIISVVMTVMMFSLAGIPMTIGFIGKLFIISMVMSAKLWWLTYSVVIGSSIGLYYYLRFTVSLFIHVPEIIMCEKNQWDGSLVVMLVFIYTVLVLVLGIFPQPLITLVHNCMM